MKCVVHTNSLVHWILEVEKYGERAFSGKGSKELIQQKKIKQLENENKKFKKELEHLKKFEAFLKANPK